MVEAKDIAIPIFAYVPTQSTIPVWLIQIRSSQSSTIQNYNEKCKELYLEVLKDPSGFLDTISAYSSSSPRRLFCFKCSTNSSRVKPVLSSNGRLSSSEKPLLADELGVGEGVDWPFFTI
jgi:hypothetical protein